MLSRDGDIFLYITQVTEMDYQHSWNLFDLFICALYQTYMYIYIYINPE